MSTPPTRDPRGWIQTATGGQFWPMDPRAEDVVIDDIGHALAHLCRFAGHVRDFYSVAEHSVRVAYLLESWGEDPRTVLHGLLHDATEAYLVDIPSPIKRSPAMAGYRAAEDRLHRVIAERFDLWPVQPDVVTQADRVLLATEARDLLHPPPAEWGQGLPAALPERIEAKDARTAKSQFLSVYIVLKSRIQNRRK